MERGRERRFVTPEANLKMTILALRYLPVSNPMYARRREIAAD